MKRLPDLTEEIFTCTICGHEYEYNPAALKRYMDLDSDIFYMRCPKDGGLALPEGVIDNNQSAIVGQAIVGEAMIDRDTLL